MPQNSFGKTRSSSADLHLRGTLIPGVGFLAMFLLSEDGDSTRDHFLTDYFLVLAGSCYIPPQLLEQILRYPFQSSLSQWWQDTIKNQHQVVGKLSPADLKHASDWLLLDMIQECSSAGQCSQNRFHTRVYDSQMFIDQTKPIFRGNYAEEIKLLGDGGNQIRDVVRQRLKHEERARKSVQSQSEKVSEKDLNLMRRLQEVFPFPSCLSCVAFLACVQVIMVVA